MLGAKTSGQSKGLILKSLDYLGADQTIVSDAFNTTFISGLDATNLQANKTYRVKWTLGCISSPSAGLVWRFCYNYPTDMVSFVNFFGLGAGATINTLTPSDGVISNAINPSLSVDNIFLCEVECEIKMGATAGDLEFGLRNVTAGDAELLADYTYVSVYEIVPT